MPLHSPRQGDRPAAAVRCPVCARADSQPLPERAGAYHLYHCPTCDLTFSDPMRAPGTTWYEEAYVIRHVAVDDRIREYFRWALDRLPPGCRILDVGCGEGTFVAYARRRGWEAWGIDFSPASIDAGRRRYGLTTLRQGTIAEFRASVNLAIQGVTAFEVLEHVESPVEFLKEMRDALAPGGHLILSVPNRDRWPIREFGDYPPNHLTRWSEQALRRAAAAAGLTVVSIQRTSRLQSINALYGYIPRAVLYGIFGMRARGIGRSPAALGRLILDSGLLGTVGTSMRRFRDLAMWIPAVLTAPVLWPVCQGYNLMLHARRMDERGAV